MWHRQNTAELESHQRAKALCERTVDRVARVRRPEPVAVEDEIPADLVRARVERHLARIVVVHDGLPIPAVEHPH